MKDLFEEHIRWMLNISKIDSFDFILSNDLPIDYYINKIISIIEKQSNLEEAHYIKEKFLKYIYDNPKNNKLCCNSKYKFLLFLTSLNNSLKSLFNSVIF